jgi:hypothetical protein
MDKLKISNRANAIGRFIGFIFYAKPIFYSSYITFTGYGFYLFLIAERRLTGTV